MNRQHALPATRIVACLLITICLVSTASAQERYQNLVASVYVRAGEVARMSGWSSSTRTGMNIFRGSVSIWKRSLYGNDTVIVESFLDEPVDVALIGTADAGSLQDLQSGERIDAAAVPPSGGFGSPRIPRMSRYEFSLNAHSWRIFRLP